MWTFETETFVSILRFETVEAAAKAASDWLVVSAENDYFPTVKLKRLRQRIKPRTANGRPLSVEPPKQPHGKSPHRGQV
jgi:hypothetical protein